MGRAPCCSKVGLHRGPWTPREDTLLTKYIQTHGDGNWRSLPKKAGLLRCGKSCRLRWMNYLRPDIKRGNITPDEDDLIIRMHSLLGNRWSLIAGRLPGRTDNEIKNYWNSHLSKLLRSQGTDPNTHKKLSEPLQQVKITKRDKNNNNNTKNKQKKSSKLSPPKVVDKPKVHQPKPVRFTSLPLSRNNSFDCNSGSSSSSRIGEVGGLIGSNDGVVLLDVPNWCAANLIDDDDHHHHNGVSFLIGDEDDHDCHANHDHHDTVLPNTSSSNLERLYEEYLSLLETDEDQSELDTFAESLLL